MSKSSKQLISLLFSLSLVLILILYPALSSESIAQSGKRCIQSLLPGIFPMMVLARQIAVNDIICNGKGAKFLSKISGYPENLVPVFLSGVFCGYPVPAIISKKIRESAKIHHQDLLLATYISNGASPGFLIFYVGGILSGSVKFGILLYLSQIAASVLISHILMPKKRLLEYTHHVPCNLADNIKDSCISFLQLCGFVMFFSLLSDYCTLILTKINLPDFLICLFSGIFEITGAISRLSPFSNVDVIFVCLMCSFGGLSVVFQIMSVMDDCNFSILKLLKIRLLIAIITALIVTVSNVFLKFLFT